MLQVTVANPPGPFTLSVDNLRLTPRAGSAQSRGGLPPAVVAELQEALAKLE